MEEVKCLHIRGFSVGFVMCAFLFLFQRIRELIICQIVNIGQHITFLSGAEEKEILILECRPLVSLLLLWGLPSCDGLWDQSGDVLLRFACKYELLASSSQVYQTLVMEIRPQIDCSY